MKNFRNIVLKKIYLHSKLMRSGNFAQVVCVDELLRNFLAEQIAGTTRRDTPAGRDAVRVTPEEVAHGSLNWYIIDSVLMIGVDNTSLSIFINLLFIVCSRLETHYK